jgi:hypothetical protein
MSIFDVWMKVNSSAFPKHPSNVPPDYTCCDTEVGCWAHGRRKFYDSREQNKEAFIVLDMIGSLYKLERQIKKSSADERHAMRQLHAIRKPPQCSTRPRKRSADGQKNVLSMR